MTAESITKLVLGLMGCFVIWRLWCAAKPARVFLVRVVDGVPRAAQGTVTSAFLEHVQRVVNENGIFQGTISGYGRGTSIRLDFSPEFTETVRQQLRNWWGIAGWPAPKMSRTGRSR